MGGNGPSSGVGGWCIAGMGGGVILVCGCKSAKSFTTNLKVRKYGPTLNMALLELVAAGGFANRFRRCTGHMFGSAVSSARVRARACVYPAFCSFGWFFIGKTEALTVSVAFSFAVAECKCTISDGSGTARLASTLPELLEKVRSTTRTG